MAQAKRRVLLLNLPSDLAAMASPLLVRQDLDVDRLRGSPAALELIRRIRFDLIFVGTPLESPTLKEVLQEIRKEMSPNRGTSTLLLSLAEGAGMTQAQIGLSQGANGIVTLPLSEEEFGVVLGRYLSIAQRKNARVTLRVEVKLDKGSKLLICQSANVSATGMLLHTPEALPLGAVLRLNFTLPNVREALYAEAKVVRLSDKSKEKQPGIGIVFTKVSSEDERKLGEYLATLV